jgi:hypothetical protein
MGARTFEQGYLDGWVSVAGDEPLRGEQTQPLPNELRNYLTGFFYGRGDALERYVPGITPTPLHEDNDVSSRHGNKGRRSA